MLPANTMLAKRRGPCRIVLWIGSKLKVDPRRPRGPLDLSGLPSHALTLPTRFLESGTLGFDRSRLQQLPERDVDDRPGAIVGKRPRRLGRVGNGIGGGRGRLISRGLTAR